MSNVMSFEEYKNRVNSGDSYEDISASVNNAGNANSSKPSWISTNAQPAQQAGPSVTPPAAQNNGVMSFDDFLNRKNSGESYEQILADVRGKRYEETKSDLGFSGWLRRLEQFDPYAGYATDELSAANMYGSTQQVPSGFRTREQREAAKQANLDAYKGMLDAQEQTQRQQYAQGYQQYAESMQRFQDPQQMFDWYERQIGAAQASGDNEWATSLQQQLDAYRQYYNEDESAGRRMQWVSEWAASHAGGRADLEEAQRNLQAAQEAYTEGSTPGYRSMTPTEARAKVAEERRQYLLDGGLDQSVIDRYKQRYPGQEASVEDVVDWYMRTREVTESIDREVANMDLESAGAAYGQAPRASDEEIRRLALEVEKWQAILEYADRHQNDDVVNAPDFQVTADRGEQEFAEYQQRDIVSEVDQEAYEQARRDAEEEADYLGYTGQDREDHIEAALYVWRQQYTAATANSNQFDPRFHTEFQEPDERWTDEERRIFYYLFATDRDRANQYAANVNKQHNDEDYEEERLGRQEHATRNIGTAFWDTIKSIPGHVLGGLPDMLRMKSEYSYRGDLYETQHQGWSQWADDAQGSIAQKLNEWSGTVREDIPIVSALIGGKGAGDLYQIFTSMGESALSIALGKGLGLGMVAPGAQLSAAELAEVVNKGAKIFSSVSFFGSAAASTTRDALQRGIDPGKALTLGFAAGCAEAMFEELSVENLLSTEGIADFFKKGILRTILTQGGVEASEEFFTEVANEFADRWINEGQSEYSSRIYALMVEGKSYEEAERTARREVLRKLWDASLGGFLSGGMMSAGQFVRFAAPAMYAKADSSTAGQLLDTTAMASPGSRAYKAGERARSRYDSTGKMSGYTATKLSTLLDAEDSTAGVQADALREAAAGVRAVTQDGETTEDLAEQIKAASEAAAQNRDVTIKNETTEAIDTVKALVEWVRGGGETVPAGLREMSRQEAEDAIIDLARKLGLQEARETGFNARTPGAQGESRESLLRRAMDRVSEYTGAAGRIISRYQDSVRETVTGRREERREAGDVFKGAAEAVELEDGSKVTIDKARRQDGKIVFDAKTADGRTVTLTRDQLSETGREVIDFLEDMTEETAADAFNMMMTDQNVYKFAVDFRTMQELGKRVAADRADTLIQQHRGSLTELQARTAFNAGQSMRDKSGPPIRRFSIKGRGRVSFDGGTVNGVKYNAVSEKTMADLEAGGQIDYITKLAKALEIDVVFFESTAEQRATKVDGEEKHALRGAQGIYTDGKIFLDVNAGMDFAEDTGRRMLLLTMAHELTHFISENAPERFLELRNAVTDWLLSSQEVNFNALVRSKLARSGSRLTYDEAVEEVIADSCETMLADSQAVRELAQQRPKLFDTIKSYIDKFLNRVLARHDEAKALQPHIKEIQAIWDRALKEAVQNRSQPLDFQSTYQQAVADVQQRFPNMDRQETEMAAALGEGAEISTDSKGELLTAVSEDGSKIVYSETTWRNGGRDKLYKNLMDNGHTADEARDAVDQIESMLTWLKSFAEDMEKQGYANLANHLKADIVTYIKSGERSWQALSALVNNGDYPVNIDLALICKKRVAYMRMMSRLIDDGIFGQVDYSGEAIADVNGILRDNGFETACLGCFVEARRLQLQEWAESIVEAWNGLVEKVAPGAGYFGFAQGDTSNLTEGEMAKLAQAFKEAGKKNDKGNLNLGQGDMPSKMQKLLANEKMADLRKKLTVADLLKPEGLTALRQYDQNLFSLIKQWYGANSPKIVQDFNPYNSELADLTFGFVKSTIGESVSGNGEYVKAAKKQVEQERGPRKKAANKAEWDRRVQDIAMRQYLYDIGGARIQSFSDFMIENVFDYLQIIADLSSRELPLHGYSKEQIFLRLFGMTGAKLNGSLIAHVERSMGEDYAGLLPVEEASNGRGVVVTVDGKQYAVCFDDYDRNKRTGSFIQSIGLKDIAALQLDPRYSPNVGSITIGVSDKQILAMLDSDFFRMVIPYHKSGMLPAFAKLVGVDQYTDYTDYQTTKVKQRYDIQGNPVDDFKKADGTSVKIDTHFDYNAKVQELGDARAAADAYLAWCPEMHPVYDKKKLIGYATFTPKFSSTKNGTDFTTHPNYYKLLEDFNVYDRDGTAAQQGAVTMTLPSEQTRLTPEQMAAYKQALRDSGLYTEAEVEKYAKKADMTFEELVKEEIKGRAAYESAQSEKWEDTVKQVEETLLRDHAQSEQERSEARAKKNQKKAAAANKKAAQKSGAKMSDRESVTLTINDPVQNSIVTDGGIAKKVMYSQRVTDPGTLKFLNDQVERGDVVRTYKTFLEIVDDDGKVYLYPPMAAMQRNDAGKKQMANAMAVNEWEESVGNPNSRNIIPKTNKNGETKWYYRLEKEDGGTPIDAAYDPYQHSSNVVLNDQFEAAYQRPRLVTYECVIPKSELTSGYRYRQARNDGQIVEAALPVGQQPWKKGTVASHLQHTDRSVYLSRWLMPTRRLSDAEVARMYKEILDREDEKVSIPFNVVPPGLLSELERIGVPIDYEGSPMYKAAQRRKAAKEGSAKMSDRETFTYNDFSSSDYVNGGRMYDYDFLVAQKPMEIATMPGIDAVSINGKIDRNSALSIGMKSLKKYGTVSPNGYAIVNNYTGRPIYAGQNSLRHSLHDNFSTLRVNARLTAIAGELIQNAIPINALKNKNAQVKGTYAMVALARSADATFAVIITVEQHGIVKSMEFIDVTHAISGRIKREDWSSKNDQAFGDNSYDLTQSSTKTIAEVLDIVKETYHSILPVSVLNHYGKETSKPGYYTGQVLFSERDNARTDRELLMETDAEELTDAERTALDAYRKKVESFEALEREVKAQQAVLDDLVKQHADGDQVEKARTKLTNLQARMQKALNTVTEAEKSDKTMLEIIRKEREIQRRRTRMATTEAFTKRELRARITKLYNDLNRRITNPSEKKNIPAPLLMQAIDVLEAINMDSSRPGSKAGQKLRNKLMELRQKYAALRNDPDFRNAAVYDDVVAELLDSMIEKVGDTTINKMSAAQMLAVYEALTALDKTARTALKIRMLGEERDAYEVALAMQQETAGVRKPSKNLFAQWLNAQLSPERMFNRMGGHVLHSAWNDMYRMLNDGQLKATQVQMDGTLIFDELLQSKEYEGFVDPKKTVDIGLRDKNGKVILVTHGMMVSLYMHLLNKQNAKHVARGGLTVPDLRDYYNGKRNRGIENSVRAVGVSQEIAQRREEILEELRHTSDPMEADNLKEELSLLGKEADLKAGEYLDALKSAIEEKMTDYDRKWVEAAQELFDDFSKARLNETTMDVYGIKRANVEHYMPIWVDGDFLATPFESVAKDMSLENAGYMKERVDSGNPMRLADISDVASTQLRRVSQYVGLMPVVRNFGKVWGKVQTGYRSSLQNTVRDRFGQAGINYVENLIADLNGARRSPDGPLGEFFNAVRGHMARASLTLSLRTAMGQAASYPTAASVVGWDALRKALFRGGRSGTIISRADQELIRKYSPLLWYRMKGYSTTELGDIASSNSKFDRTWRKMRWATGWIQAFDGGVVGRLWYAAEYYVQDHEPGLTKGTDEYYRKVAEVFNDIVEKTQPNYTTMQRPDILRNPNALVRQLTMFLTQRLQNFNILYDSAATYSRAKADLKAGLNGVTQADVQEAGRSVRRAAVSQVVAAATIAAFKFLADGLLHSMNAYRDDDKELTTESVSMELLDMFIDSLAGNVLGGSEVYDLIESRLFGKTYYGIEVSGLSTVTDVIESVNKTLDAALADGASLGTVWSKGGHKLAQNIGSLFGIPYSNAEKIVKGLYWHTQDLVNGEFLSYEAGVDRTTAQQAHRLYRAYTSSNFGTAKRIREEVGDDEKLDAALVSFIKKQFAEGAITQKQATDYLTRFAGKTQEAAEKTMREYSCEVESGTKYSQIRDALLTGQITEDEAADLWKKYGGLSAEDARIKAAWTVYENAHDGTAFSASTFATYYRTVRTSGVSAEEYETIRTGADTDGNGSIKQQEAADALAAAIRAGDITLEQAEAIWKSINKSWKKSYSQFSGS